MSGCPIITIDKNDHHQIVGIHTKGFSDNDEEKKNKGVFFHKGLIEELREKSQ